MKTVIPVVLCIAFASPPVAKAQQPAPSYVLRTVIEPSMSIGGEKIANCVDVESAVLNDLGDIAFGAYCGDRNRIFTTKRIVVSSGETVDGKVIELPPQVVAINNRGQVLYEAFFSDAADQPMKSWRYGLFLEHQFVAIAGYDTAGNSYSYTLTDDGRILAEIRNPDRPHSAWLSADTPPSKVCDANGHVPARQRAKSPRATEMPPAQLAGAIPLLATNSCGQLLLNMHTLEPLLVLATPIRH